MWYIYLKLKLYSLELFVRKICSIVGVQKFDARRLINHDKFRLRFIHSLPYQAVNKNLNRIYGFGRCIPNRWNKSIIISNHPSTFVLHFYAHLSKK